MRLSIFSKSGVLFLILQLRYKTHPKCNNESHYCYYPATTIIILQERVKVPSPHFCSRHAQKGNPHENSSNIFFYKLLLYER